MSENLREYLGIKKHRLIKKRVIKYSSQNELKPIVKEISKNIDLILSSESTLVVAEKNSLIIMEEKSVFSNAKLKKYWICIVLAATGCVLNENPKIKVRNIFYSDSDTAIKGNALLIKATVCKKLQAKISEDKINLDQF
jgi:hypothetical protein